MALRLRLLEDDQRHHDAALVLAAPVRDLVQLLVHVLEPPREARDLEKHGEGASDQNSPELSEYTKSTSRHRVVQRF